MREELRRHEEEIAREFGITSSHKLYGVEMHAEEHLLNMTERGVRVDTGKVVEKISELKINLESMMEEISSRTSNMITKPNSSKEVGSYYQNLGYLFPKTAKGNYQVNQDTLEDVNVEPELTDLIKRYRKTLSSCSQLESIFKEIDDNGRVHPKYHSTSCATGRIYTSGPNIQGWGDDAKSLIIPDDGYKLMVADYKAEELRILAAISNCKNLLKAFSDGVDVHSQTYSMMMGVPLAEVTEEQRAIGKVLNFATIYGQSAEGLAKDLKVSVERAAELQQLYFQTYPEVREWLDSTIAEAKRTSQVSTPWGRTRKISFAYDKAKGERQATNTPIQGAGADVIKMVLSRSCNESEDVKFLTTIHDSIILEYKETIPTEDVTKWVKNLMELDLGSVVLEVEVK